MNKKKVTIIVILVSIILAVVAITSSTYALFYNEKVASNKNEYSTGLLSIEATSKTNTISLDNAIPMEDSEGVETKPYIFTITNKGNLDYTFNVRLLSTSNNTINPSYIKLKIDDASVTTLSSLTNSTIKSNLTLKAKESVDIEIRVWLASNTPNTEIGKSFTSNLVIDGQAVYTEPSRDDEIYTVTFDPNGGSLGTQASTKQVVYGSTYGNLPTPTRTGYTFKGWNGKNLFNENNITTGKYLNIYGNFEQLEDWAYSDYIEIEAGKTYTFNPNSVKGSSAFHCVYDSNKNLINTYDSGLNTITMPSNAKYIRITYRTSNSSNIQLEEGSTATEYEPYYITNDTRVVQNKNHTLTAIWEKATPIVTLDANGGTIPSGNDWTGSGSSATKQVTYDSTYGNLPTPTRTGYIFKGWNGKNMFNINRDIKTNSVCQVSDNSLIIYKTTNSYTCTGEYMPLVANHTYTVSANISDTFSGRFYGFLCGRSVYSESIINNKIIVTNKFSGGDDKHRILISQNNNNSSTNIIFNGDSLILSNIQLEEGNTATPYEPYYITNDTRVVQDKNHTLTAIWEQN